jgi:hypothetical protein
MSNFRYALGCFSSYLLSMMMPRFWIKEWRFWIVLLTLALAEYKDGWFMPASASLPVAIGLSIAFALVTAVALAVVTAGLCTYGAVSARRKARR